MYIAAERRAEELRLTLSDHWRAGALVQLDAALAALDIANAPQIVIDPAALSSLDLAGAWRLRKLIAAASAAGSRVRFAGTPPPQLTLIDEVLGQPGSAAAPGRPAAGADAPLPQHMKPDGTAAAPLVLEDFDFEEPVAAIGKKTLERFHETALGLGFLGRLSIIFLRALLRPRHLRPTSIARHIYDTGITAIPIVALIAFLISIIVAYLGAQQLQYFGAEIFVVDLVTIGTLRELGVLLTAIIVAGRSGSAFAAEIGSMQLNEEVDALKAIGVEPYEVLVVPRIIGLVVALPLLTVIADVIGLAGGAILCRFLLDMPVTQYLTRANDAIGNATFWVGFMKAPVFAILIALAGTYRGMQVQGSSRELGRLTTTAVVQAIFLVILADALFAVLFMEIGL